MYIEARKTAWNETVVDICISTVYCFSMCIVRLLNNKTIKQQNNITFSVNAEKQMPTSGSRHDTNATVYSVFWFHGWFTLYTVFSCRGGGIQYDHATVYGIFMMETRKGHSRLRDNIYRRWSRISCNPHVTFSVYKIHSQKLWQENERLTLWPHQLHMHCTYQLSSRRLPSCPSANLRVVPHPFSHLVSTTLPPPHVNVVTQCLCSNKRHFFSQSLWPFWRQNEA